MLGCCQGIEDVLLEGCDVGMCCVLLHEAHRWTLPIKLLQVILAGID